jgi:hypothetical protein
MPTDNNSRTLNRRSKDFRRENPPGISRYGREKNYVKLVGRYRAVSA